jgi:acyl carrier protein phosphodiesterase
MNYLFHLYFSTAEPATLLGACLGDFFKGNIKNLSYSQPLKKGLILHRQLDAFADTHQIILENKTRFPQAQRRMAGIALDIFYDHFLAKNWAQYSRQDLATFCQTFYTQAKPEVKGLPPEAQYFFKKLSTEDWLTAYAEVQTIHLVLKRMGQYLRFENTLAETASVFTDHYTYFSESCTQLMLAAKETLTHNNGQL